MGKRLSTGGIWLGLFAMLMIHVGPLYSALRSIQAPTVATEQHAHHEHASPPHHHHQPTKGEPAWVAALELCGYCELLTLNPPLAISLDLAFPRHQPERFLPLPEEPQREAARYASSYPRAPPYFHA